MDDSAQHELIELNKRFYDRCASSFSETRTSPWGGWEMVYQQILGAFLASGKASGSTNHAKPFQILDVGCGNMRFERGLSRYLEDRTSSSKVTREIHVRAVDSCAELACPNGADEPLPSDIVKVEFVETDILDGALSSYDGKGMPALSGTFDAVVCFGVMHHVPGIELCIRLLRMLSSAVSEGGMLAVSFWQFANNTKFLEKAQRQTRKAALAGLPTSCFGPSDFYLGWQDDTELFRYCHSFTDQEVSYMISAIDAPFSRLKEYSCDGKGDRMNRYALLLGRE